MAYLNERPIAQGEVTFFAVTDDHARQEHVWEMLEWNNSPTAIRRALTEGQVPSSERRAVFVGAEAYEAAGGVIVRDLFAEEGHGYFTDIALLDRLVAMRFEAEP